MKKILITLFFAAGVLSANAQTKTTKDLLLDTICTCINNKKADFDKMTQKQMETAITQCMMSDGLELMMKYAEESGVEMTDQTGMKKIGVTIGTRLYGDGDAGGRKQRCKIRSADCSSPYGQRVQCRRHDGRNRHCGKYSCLPRYHSIEIKKWSGKKILYRFRIPNKR